MLLRDCVFRDMIAISHVVWGRQAANLVILKFCCFKVV